MSFITSEDLSTHIYAENIDAIIGNDLTLVDSAIDTAVQEAKGYLSKYDRDAVFSATGNSRNALLLTFVKDMAVWHLIVLCNAGIDRTVRQDRYERAVSWLKSVQKGSVSPDLPMLEAPDVAAGGIDYGSNPKRTQHF